MDLEQFRAGQAAGFEKALTSFLDDCAARTACAFHEGGKSAAAFDALMASIDAKPLPATAGARSPVGRAGDRRIRRPRGALRAGIVAGPGELARPGQARRRLAAARDRRPVPGSQAQRLLFEPARCLHGQHLPRLHRPHRRRHVHGLGEEAGGVGAALRRAHRLQRPCLRVLAGRARTDARDGLGGRCSADRRRRHDRRSGDALRLGAGPGQGADVGGAGHPRGRGPHGIPHRLVRAAGGRRVPARADGAEGRVDLPVGPSRGRLAAARPRGSRRRRSARPGRPDRRSPDPPRRR